MKSLTCNTYKTNISRNWSLFGVSVRHVSKSNRFAKHSSIDCIVKSSSLVKHSTLLRQSKHSSIGSKQIICNTICCYSMALITDQRGAHNSIDYRIYYRKSSGEPLSAWHDIPMFADETNRIYHMVCEIPRWSNAKMEISTKEPLNPIKQDIKKGELRYVRNPFPHKGYIWNYGAIPQTWEDPKHLDEETGCKGDNDPIDVVEIGQRVAQRGEVMKIKVLGVMALIDEGETDWKVIAIDVRDPLADQLNDIQDVEMLMPGLLRATHEWFKIYKIPDGKPPNEFAFNGEPKNRKFAEKIISETHEYWKELTSNTLNESELDLKNVCLANTHTIDVENGRQIINQRKESAELEALAITDQTAIDKWFYITLA